MNRFYLPQLDSVRFLAFLLVFVHHSPSAAPLFPPTSVPSRVAEWFQVNGYMGVDLFLVLSAFLITTLLLREWEQEAGRIRLRDFYFRRILRIWPLYYLMLFLAFLVLPLMGLFAPRFGTPAHHHLLNTYLLPFATLYANFAIGIHHYASVWSLSHLWTITLEEQFYLLWPAILKIFLSVKRGWLWGVIVLLLLLSLGLRMYLHGHTRHPMIWTNTLCRLDPLLAGIALGLRGRGDLRGTPALALAEFGSGVALLISVTLAPNVAIQSPHVVWQYLATAAGCGLLLDATIRSATGPVAWLFSRKPFVWLGRMTYGLYVYHILGIQMASHIATRHLSTWPSIHDGLAGWVFQFAFSLGLTILVAALSYYTLERYFLRLKMRFTHVASRPTPGEATFTRP